MKKIIARLLFIRISFLKAWFNPTHLFTGGYYCKFGNKVKILEICGDHRNVMFRDGFICQVHYSKIEEIKAQNN